MLAVSYSYVCILEQSSLIRMFHNFSTISMSQTQVWTWPIWDTPINCRAIKLCVWCRANRLPLYHKQIWR